MKIMVINGPNINMLGIREPDVYGKDTFKSLIKLVKQTAKEQGVKVKCFQSNHEGAIVGKIQSLYKKYDGIVINPAGYTHTSVAILDALKAVQIPTVEVHISKVDEREDFRQISFVSKYCEKRVVGQGINGYKTAIEYLAKRK